MPFFLMLMLLLLALAMIYAAVCFVFSGFIIHSHRQPIVRSPRDYGLEYEDIEFKSTDGLDLKGWFIPGKSGKTIIITHPFPFNRHGFIEKNQGWLTRFRGNVDILKTAQSLNEAGYSVLMFDFRNHGQSQRGITGIGLTEYQDILGAMDYLRDIRKINPEQTGLVGFCMGANSMIAALSKAKERFKNVKCFVAVQPVTPGLFMSCYIKRTYTAAGLLLLPLVDKMCQWRGGYSFKEMSPVQFCKEISMPTLYIQLKEDCFTELADIQGFYRQTPGPKELMLIEEKMGRFDAYNYVGTHSEMIIAFLKKYL